MMIVTILDWNVKFYLKWDFMEIIVTKPIV